MDHCKSAFVQKGLLQSEQSEYSVKGNTHINVYSKKQKPNYLPIMKSFMSSQKKLRQWSQVYAHNDNCEIIRRYILRYIQSKEKVSWKKESILKHGWIKETLSFSRYYLSFCLPLFFHCSASGVALHNKRGW